MYLCLTVRNYLKETVKYKNSFDVILDVTCNTMNNLFHRHQTQMNMFVYEPIVASGQV